MPKIVMVEVDKLLESSTAEAADQCLSDVLSIVESHGVCYLRFTKEDGILIIQPRYYQKFNGIISDA
jgi:hypothetical protein